MRKALILTVTIIFIFLYNTNDVSLALLGVPFLYMLCYINTFLTINFYFSKDFLGNRFYFWKKDVVKQNISTFLISTLIMVFIASLLFPLNDSKELGNQFIWGCYSDYVLYGIIIIWGLGLIINMILLIIGLINPNRIRFESRKKIFKSLLTINVLTFLLIFIFYISIKLLSSKLHGASWSC